jgi:hypothetical protein
MNIFCGDKVRHPKMLDCGVGKVLDVSADGKARIFFIDAGEKLLGLKHVNLERVESEEDNHPILDNPSLGEQLKDTSFKSLPAAKVDFLRDFPDGFRDEGYFAEERRYKLDAHNLMHELLSREIFEDLLGSGDYAEICKRALQVVNKSTLIFPNEKMALKDGLKIPNSEKLFAQNLFTLLFGEGELKERFEGFCRYLEEIKAAKWTTATYFLFITFPSKFMFMKPTIAQHAAMLVKAELNYRSELNWLTYKCLLDFSDYLAKCLTEMDMEPQDMIDVQSFMWCIAPR